MQSYNVRFVNMMACVGAHNRAQGFCCSGVFQSFYTDVQKKQKPTVHNSVNML